MDERNRERLRLLLVLVGGLMALAWIYRSTIHSMASKWADDAAYTYGFLVAPISLWVALSKRRSLAGVSIRPSWLGVLGMVVLGMVWVVARGTGVLVLEQFAVVGMVSATVVAVLGPKPARLFAFPLAFLFFMVPFGRAVVPWLMQATAHMATLALQWSGIPVYRTHMYIAIPGGTFEVARACSGVAFLMTALVLGVLYAHLNFATLRKRVLCVLVAVCVPVVANGVRVYLTIAAAHLTDMRIGPGVEHRTFGSFLFIVVMLGLFWLGRRWQDARPTFRTTSVPEITSTSGTGWSWAPVPAALLVMFATPPYHAALASGIQGRNAKVTADVRLPDGTSAWSGPAETQDTWIPQYRNALAQRQATYRDARGARIDVYVACYGLGTSEGVEMISYDHVLVAGEHESLAQVRHRTVELGDRRMLVVREVVTPGRGRDYLVWQWFVVGAQPVTSSFAVKALEAAAWVTRGASTERIVTLATPFDPLAHERLESFARTYRECVAIGFAADSCG